ncbi:uncharacterized protein (DUF697 family) [Oxalobacteraceae bacterium GrIS 1.11]
MNAEQTDSAVQTVPADVPVVGAARLNDALHLTKNHAMTAMAVGILPVPGLDLIALTGVQLNLLRKIGGLYGFTLSDEVGKKLVSSVLGGYLPLAIAGPVGSLLKFIPGVGMAAGALAQSTLAGASTYAIGQLFTQHFEKGGTFLDVKPSEMGQKVKQQVEEGKQFLKRQAPSGKPDAP